MGVSENVGFTDLLTLDVFILNAGLQVAALALKLSTRPVGFICCSAYMGTEVVKKSVPVSNCFRVSFVIGHNKRTPRE